MVAGLKFFKKLQNNNFLLFVVVEKKRKYHNLIAYPQCISLFIILKEAYNSRS